MTGLPCSESDIDAFLEAFEGCTLPKERWTHGAHLLTGACYVHRFGQGAALERMRVCVRRYNESMGGKNTETITVMWIRLLDGLRREVGVMERAEFARLAVERFVGEKDVFRRYYDFDVVGSVEARRVWVEPNLMELD